MSIEIRGPIRRPEYHVALQGIGGVIVEAPSLDALADRLEHLFRTHHPREHVGIQMLADGTVRLRLGFADSFEAGHWAAA